MAQRNKNLSNFKKGSIEMLFLYFLATEGDSYCYELTQKLKDDSDDILSCSEGTTYTALYKLLGNNLISNYEVVTEQNKTRVYYHIEESGKARLAELLADYKAVTSTIEKIIEF